MGRSSDPYEATSRAITACGEWSKLRIAGKTVVIKPNLVFAAPGNSGVTTDAEVTRAVLDRVLAAGPAAVKIIESGRVSANFGPCGYDGFRTYDPGNRIELVDTSSTQPHSMVHLPYAMAYPAMSMPTLVLASDVVYISIGKLKTHVEAMATLSLKNSFGLPNPELYSSTVTANPYAPRLGMHDRGLNQTIVDLGRNRPIHFAVIDGVMGMEDRGPVFGVPVRMDTVIAGLNSVAVDRVALSAMQIPQHLVPSLTWAARAGLGPADLSRVAVLGDTLVPRAFVRPIVPVTIEYPRVAPVAFRPTAGQTATATTWYSEPCRRVLEVVRLYDDSTVMDPIRTLAPLGGRQSGYEQVVWDGRDDAGNVVPPGRYSVHVRVYKTGASRPADAVGWVWVAA